MRTVFLVVGLLLMTARPGGADIGILVMEPVQALGFFTRVGHAGVYLSNICPDASPVKMRLCRAGERGGVVSKYSPLGEYEDYDWAIVPFDVFMHGVESPDLAPLIATRTLQRAVEQHQFGPTFSSALTLDHGGAPPDGQWKAAIAARFDRTIYLFSVSTTVADDTVIVDAFNAAPNKARFNFFYQNCSNQAKALFDLVLPRTMGDRTSGATMETPKGLAKALVDHAAVHPELHLRAYRFAQIPGTLGRSQSVLFPMENSYRNASLWPWWLFGGYREVALGAILYHQVISPFSILGASRDYISATAGQLTYEQRRLRLQQDEIRVALASARHRGVSVARLWDVQARVFRRLAEIRREKRAEIERVEGTTRQWRALEQEFRAAMGALEWGPFAPPEVVASLTRSRADGRLSNQLLRYFDMHGEFSVDRDGRGPWMRLRLADGQTHTTGLSASEILSGDPRVSALVLVAVLDHGLHQPEARSRDALASVDAALTLFRQAGDAIRRQQRAATLAADAD